MDKFQIINLNGYRPGQIVETVPAGQKPSLIAIPVNRLERLLALGAIAWADPNQPTSAPPAWAFDPMLRSTAEQSPASEKEESLGKSKSVTDPKPPANTKPPATDPKAPVAPPTPSASASPPADPEKKK